MGNEILFHAKNAYDSEQTGQLFRKRFTLYKNKKFNSYKKFFHENSYFKNP